MRFVILHGTSASSASNWFPWLKGELEQLGHEVWVPDLPSPDAPDIRLSTAFLLDSGYDFNRAVLVGHSAGAVAAKGLLQELDGAIKLAAVVLVGVFSGDLGRENLRNADMSSDYDSVRQRADKFVVVHSDDDNICPIDGAREIANQLGAEFIVEHGMGHFIVREQERFKQFPELLEIIKEKVIT